MSSVQPARILIVEDDADLGLSLSNALVLAGYACALAPSGSAALNQVERDHSTLS